MLISIIIPNYNKAPYIEKTLQSIIAQTYQNWEAIVVDDGSSDGSQKIIQKIAHQDLRIRFIERTQLPKGGSVCRNIGLKQAQGEYLMFFDSDDIMSPNCLKNRMTSIQQNPLIHFMVFPVGNFYHKIGDHKHVWIPSGKNHLKKFLSHDLPWNIMSSIWQTKFIKQNIQGFDETFPRLQDVEFHTRALMVPNVQYKIADVKQPDCFYRIDPQRSNQNYNEMLKVMWPGIQMYIQKFDSLIKNKSLKTRLRGTLFSFLTQVNYLKATKRITDEEYHFHLECINSFAEQTTTLFHLKTVNYLKKYSYLYQKGAWKIKGFNYLCKNYIQKLCIISI
ncbi:glycosyltransferase family 2 protein [Geofilum sp. OHC36d9]|uniref:glycosyltransferase family 2 protein n=1 Tax=Geofilum sp. OHC36d9 TaxID=3458413 RepID=UPI004033802B